MPLEAFQGVGRRNDYRCVECGGAVADPLDSHTCGEHAPARRARDMPTTYQQPTLAGIAKKHYSAGVSVHTDCTAPTAKGRACSKWAITKAEWEKWKKGYIYREAVRPYLDKLCLLHAKLAAGIS